jgi:hypothetical protein
MESYSDAVINVGDKCLDEDENCRWWKHSEKAVFKITLHTIWWSERTLLVVDSQMPSRSPRSNTEPTKRQKRRVTAWRLRRQRKIQMLYYLNSAICGVVSSTSLLRWRANRCAGGCWSTLQQKCQ